MSSIQTIHLPLVQYWRWLGLESDPFVKTNLAYIPPSWRSYIDFLSHTERYRNNLLLVIGDAGVGKSTLLEIMLNQWSNTREVLSFKATKSFSPEQFSALLASELKIFPPLGTYQEVQRAVRHQLDQLAQTGRDPIVLIDEAEKLPQATQSLCLDIIHHQMINSPALQILLFGRTSLATRFESLLARQEHLRADAVKHLVIKAFTLEDTHEYIKDCLKKTGYDGRVILFTQGDIQTLYQNSKGLPEQILIQAKRNLQHLVLPERVEKKRFSKKQLNKIIWWGGVSVTLILLLKFALPFILDPTDQSKSNWIKRFQSLKLNVSFSTPSVPPVKINHPPRDPVLELEKENSPVDSSIAPGSRLIIAGKVTTVQKKIEKNNITSPQEQTIVDRQIKELSQIQKPDPRHSKTDELPIVSEKNTSPNAVAQPVFLTEMEQRLLKIDKKIYTVQLFISADSNQIQTFINKYHIASTAMIYRAIRSGQPVYIILLGFFSSRQEAEQGIKDLSALLQKEHPWIRTFKEVHEDIEQLLNSKIKK